MISTFEVSVVKKTASTVALLLVFILLASTGFAQQLTGTLSATITDAAGAVVPNAKVTMKNDQSGDVRTTVSNGSGYFTVTAVQPGSYSVTVEAAGFKTWQQTGIVFAQGDNRTLPSVKLDVGQVTETVEIKAGADVVIPDTAEVSTTLNTQLVEDVPIVGRDAGELLKLMPGMALNNSGTQGSSFNPTTVGSNNGPVGAYSANGTQPNGAMAYMLDGANLVDPGNAGTQIANINQDMVSEVKVLMSSYSAEYAKGPVIFEAFSKSGGNQFHGEGYFYARNSIFNSWDAYTKTQFLSDVASFPALQNQFANSLEPPAHFYYPGGNIGGPIILPFTDFNRNRKKLFFWAGYEYMRQTPAVTPIDYNVPTVEQKAGDFTENTINGQPGIVNGSNTPLLTTLQQNPNYGYAYMIPYGLPSNAVGHIMPTSDFDPNLTGGTPDGKHGLLQYYPNSNILPGPSNGYNNYQYTPSEPQNRWEATGKVDYAISDNDKLSVSYTRQIETDVHPIGVWWTPPWTLPYPSNVQAPTTSQDFMSNYTHVFSPTTTNEFVFTYARYINPSNLTNASAASRSTLGFKTTGFYGVTTSQVPNVEGPWGGAVPNIDEFSFDGAFNGGNGFGAIKKDPSLYDNFTKVIGSHTLKAGFYWDTSQNVQSSAGLQLGNQGNYNVGWGANDTGNVVADFLLGVNGNYQQQNIIPTFDIQFHQWSIYAQDSFKANRQLTLNYGLRFDHMGQWYGPPNGMAVWDPASYNNTASAPANTGLLFHSINSSIPLSGLQSPLFYYEPRVGLAYDIFGTGKTVLRAGVAWFRYQLAVNDVGGPTGAAAGQFTAQTPGISPYNASTGTGGYGQIDQSGFYTPPSQQSLSSYISGTGSGATISVFPEGDNRTPYVMDWNITVSQALPWRSVFEASYVGNKSQNELINGGNGGIDNLNNFVPGSFFLPDPVLGVTVSTAPPTCTNSTPANNSTLCATSPNYAIEEQTANGNGFSENHFRPLKNYTNVNLITHGSYANYNSLQLSWQKQSGHITFLTNYTFSKVLGIRDGQTDNGTGNGTTVDPYNLKNNYGPLQYDHTNIVNASAVWQLPKLIHGNHFAGGAVNGWQLSTYTTYQSGAPLQTSTGGSMNAGYPGLTVPSLGAPDLPNNSVRLPNGLVSTSVNESTWLGTNAYGGSGGGLLLPQLVCDPRKHAAGLYFNPGCFQAPAFGTQGTLIWPYIRNPAYFDSDLALFKNFQISERQKLQFRLSATNWLNHPLGQFGLAGTGDEALSFTRTYTVPISASAASVGGTAGSECAFLGLTIQNGVCNATATTLSGANTNTSLTGKPAFKTMSRQLLFAVKYYF
ncbi:MAG TPA: carboxypeptidase regulatory-like domain-containing protein [Candidatus Sulfotelmatobacter sp.]